MLWPLMQQVIDTSGSRGLRGAFDRVMSVLGLDRQPTPGYQKAAFTIAFVGLAAKMAKADGVAVSAEAHAFERCFTVPPEELANVRRLYDLATADVAGYDAYARRIARLLADEPQMLTAVLECLFVIACADGIMHEGEDRFLRQVAGIFGIGADDFEAMRRLFVTDPDDPYTTLGVTADADAATVRARYLALVKENHPDALLARGVPEEFHPVAARKIAVINAAYDAIRARRKPVRGEQG